MKRSHEVILCLLIVALLVFARVTEAPFVSWKAQSLLAPHVWELALVAVPMFLIVLSGGIDLSVGSIVAISAVSFGLAFEKGIPLGICCFIAVFVGTVCGAVNGAFVAKLKVHPLLVTLATMSLFRGLAEGVSLARPISGFPESFSGGLSGWVPGAALLALLLVSWFVTTQFRAGRWIVAIGQNEVASLYSRIPVVRVKFLLYAFCGLICGVAALFLTARNNTAKADLGVGMELEAITAVVLGGASIHGGKGTVVGTALGLILIHELKEFVSWHWKASELNLIATGAVLIIAVVAQQIGANIASKKLGQNGS